MLARKARCLGNMFLVVGLLAAAPASAHPKIDAARVRLEAAEFDTALRLLAEAEAGTDLERADVLALLELRALAYLALRDESGAEQSLRVLAALAPEHRFGPRTSPDLVQAFARAREDAPPPLRLSLEREFAADGVHLRGRVFGDGLHLVRGLRLSTRVDAGEWRSALADETIVSAKPGQEVRYQAFAIGFGGAAIANTDEESVRMPARATIDSASAKPWLYIGLAAGAIAIAATVLAIALSHSASHKTQPGTPQVVGP